MRYYVKNTCPVCGGNYEFPQEEIGREFTCPHCSKPVVLRDPRPVWIRLLTKPWDTSGVKKIMALASLSFCGSLVIHFAKGSPFSGIVLLDLARLIGMAFVPFSVAMLVAVFVKGKAGIIIGLSIVVLIVGLMILGAILPAPGPGPLGIPARVKESPQKPKP